MQSFPSAAWSARLAADKLLDSLPGLGVILFDPATHQIVRCNTFACQLIGQPEDTLIGRGIYDAVRDTETASLLDDGNRSVLVGHQWPVECWLVLGSEGRIRAEVTQYLYKDPFNLGDFIVCLLKNISADHVLRVKATDLEQATTSLLHGLPLPVFWVNLKGVITGCNMAFSSFCGLDGEPLLNKALLDLFPGSVAAQFNSVCVRASSTNAVMSRQITVWSKQDHAHREVVAHVCPLHDVYGNVSGSVLVLYDITDLVLGQKITSRIAQHFDSSIDAVLLTDADNRIEYANKSFTSIFEYSAEELLGKNPSLLRSDFHDTEFFNGMWRRLSAGLSWTGNMVSKTKGGRYVRMLTTIIPIMGGQSRPLAYMAIKHKGTYVESPTTDSFARA
jgi:PAS domain S-box-containing protein